MTPSPIPPKVKSLFITQSPDTAYLNNIDFGMGKIPAIVSLLRIKTHIPDVWHYVCLV